MHFQQFTFLLFCCVFVAGLATAASQQVSYRQYSASSLTLKQGQYINVPRNASRCKPITFLDLCDCKGVFCNTTFSQLPYLRAVNISKTQIHYLSCDTFASLKRLQLINIKTSSVDIETTSSIPTRQPLPYFDELNFQNSTVNGLSRNALYDLSALRTLRFDYSQISNINSNSFNDLARISQLLIRSSTVTNFDFSLISRLSTLQYLSLHNIQTNSPIDYNIFASLPNLQTIQFNANVYNQLDFASFKSLRTVEFVRDDIINQPNSTLRSTFQYLQQNGIEYKIVRRPQV